MTRWGNAITGGAASLAAAWMYMLDAPVLVMVAIILLLALTFYVREHTWVAILYLGLAINQLILLLAFWLADGQVSYLSDDSFTPYYSKALLLEIMFWSAFGCLTEWRLRVVKSTLSGCASVALRFSINGLMLAAITALVLELVLSSSRYFAGYSESSDVGTVAYEFGCLLLALAVVLRNGHPQSFKGIVLEVVCISLALFVAIGSGKRLPIAYVVIAYMLLCLRRYGKARTGLLYLGVSLLGYVFGILRDMMTLSSVDVALLTAGTESTNQGAVLHASAVYLRIVDESLSSVMDRGISFISNFFGALLLPLSWLPDQAQINIYAMRYYPVQGNGGFVSSYAYFFFGWVGPVLFAAALAWLLGRRGRWIETLAVIVLLTSPRWTLYNLGPVVRLISLTVAVLALLALLPRNRSVPVQLAGTPILSPERNLQM